MTPSTVASRTEQEAAIRKVEADLVDTWNHHDARARAKPCTEDGDAVNVLVWSWQGCSQIEKKIADAHAYIFRESTLTDDEIHIKFLTSEIAVVHVRWSISGAQEPRWHSWTAPKGYRDAILHKLGEVVDCRFLQHGWQTGGASPNGTTLKVTAFGESLSRT